MNTFLSKEEMQLIIRGLNLLSAETYHAAVGSENLSVLCNYAAKCADLADRLHNELEAAEHAENLLDNME